MPKRVRFESYARNHTAPWWPYIEELLVEVVVVADDPSAATDVEVAVVD